MVSTDRLLCVPKSSVRERTMLYAREAGYIDVIVFALAKKRYVTSVDGPLRVSPTQSRTRWLYIVDAYRAARRLEKPDVVTVQDPFETGVAGWLIAKHFRVPLHVQIHTDIFDSYFRTHSWLNRARVVIARWIVRRAARVRVVSERIALTLPSYMPVSILPIYTDTQAFARLERSKHPRFKIALLYIGRLEKEKRAEIALQALADARAAGHDAGLTIVGEGKEEALLRALTRSKGLERFVEFVGRRDDITPYLKEADAVLVPSVYEGYGLVIVEALASGVPVIATDVGVARESGAIIADAQSFSETVLQWISSGPRTASLHGYPYASREEYVRAYVSDVRACISEK